MGYCVEPERMDEILRELSESYHIYAPRLDAQKKRVRFGKITSVRQIVNDRQSDYSPKEVFYPISQVMFYFREDRVDECELKDDKKILIFARSCDINAVHRPDNIFLKNGGAEDIFYKRIREKVRYILMECPESFENCFCVSAGSNRTDEYSAAVRLGTDEILVDIRDEELKESWKEEDQEKAAALLDEQKKFVKKHLTNWVYSFTSDIVKFSERDFYKGIARITNGFMKKETELLRAGGKAWDIA